MAKRKGKSEVVEQKAPVGKIRKAKLDENTGSYSKISAFLRCPWLYYQEYVLEKAIKPNANIVYGLKVHERAELLSCKSSIEEVTEVMKGYTPNDIGHAIAYAEFFSNKVNAEVPEFESTIKVGEYYLEFHIDRIVFDEYGNLFILDLKTSPAVMSKEELAYDMQLTIYAWAYLRWLEANYEKEKNDTIRTAKKIILNKEGGKKVYVGHWAWRHDYPIFVEYDRTRDYTDRYVSIMKEINDRDPNQFPKQVNEYCAGCPFINECVPDRVPDTFAGLKHKAKMLEKQISIKEAHMLETFTELDTKVLPAVDENGNYYLRQRKYFEYDTDTFLQKIDNDIAKAKSAMKVTKTVIEQFGLIPGQDVPERLTNIAQWIEFKTDLKDKKK